MEYGGNTYKLQDFGGKCRWVEAQPGLYSKFWAIQNKTKSKADVYESHHLYQKTLKST